MAETAQPMPGPTSTGAMRRERRDAAAHRQRILDVAQRLFAAHSVAAVSMHQIAQAACIGQGTLYRRYANKGELCKALLYAQHARFAADLQIWVGANTHLSALARLDGVLTRFLTFVENGQTLFAAIVAAELHNQACDIAATSHVLPPGEVHWFQWFTDLLSNVLQDAVAHHEIAPLDIPFTVDAIMGTLNPLFLGYQQSVHGYTHDRILAGLRRIFVTGIIGDEA